jgi:hypothetical protein
MTCHAEVSESCYGEIAFSTKYDFGLIWALVEVCGSCVLSIGFVKHCLVRFGDMTPVISCRFKFNGYLVIS